MTTLFKTLSAIKRSVTDNNEDIFWLTKSREWATENDLKNHSRNYIRTNIIIYWQIRLLSIRKGLLAKGTYKNTGIRFP